jgi:transcriptional regulator with XRE-family HTH domain
MALKDIRIDRGLTQEQLAALADVDQATISKLERETVTSPSWETVGRLARALGVDPHQLFPLAEAPTLGEARQ